MALTQVPNAMLSSDLQGVTPGFKNRIINGAMMIDQRNAGASFSISANNNAYVVDRFRCDAPVGQGITAQQVVDAPAGFYNSFKYTAGTASTNAGDNSQIFHSIEGVNVADLNWGTANAQPITFSFWAKSSLAGTFGLTMENSAQNRCYVTSYSLPVANTWTYITKTILGDTTGTWLKDNGRGIVFRLDMGGGTSVSGAVTNAWGSAYYSGVTGAVKLTQNTGATFNITGLQLEKGSVATAFDYRSIGQELALCHRYFEVGVTLIQAYGNNTNGVFGSTPFKAVKRAFPTMTDQGLTYPGQITLSSFTLNAAAPSFADGLSSYQNSMLTANLGGAPTIGMCRYLSYFTASAEL